MAQVGWTTLLAIVTFQLVYFYMPSKELDGSYIYPVLIHQESYAYIFNAVTLVNLLGRVMDSISDPFIAGSSDRCTSALGRRVPFMRYAAIPCAVLCFAMFVPIVRARSVSNIVWLAAATLFFVSLTIYSVLFMALIPEVGHTSQTRLELNVVLSVGMAIGSMLATLPTSIGVIFSDDVVSSCNSHLTICVLSAVLMLIPSYALDETKYCRRTVFHVHVPALSVCLATATVIYAWRPHGLRRRR